MLFVRIIDENGFFIEDAFVDELTEFTIETPCPMGFYRPKWNGKKWIEGLSEEEIAELTKPQPHEPSELDLLHAQIQASGDYVDFLEEVVVELIQAVYQ